MTTFADQAFCNTYSQFCKHARSKEGTARQKKQERRKTEDSVHGQSERRPNRKICARAIQREPQQKNQCAGDPAGSRETENPFTRYFAVALSKIKRKPSSVSCEFVSVMVLDALATRTARPPVATTGAV